jgi:hypothetical protein
MTEKTLIRSVHREMETAAGREGPDYMVQRSQRERVNFNPWPTAPRLTQTPLRLRKIHPATSIILPTTGLPDEKSAAA